MFKYFLLISALAYGQKYSLRKCALLPVIDNIGSNHGFNIFKNVEKYLIHSKWCYYKYNSKVLDLFQQTTFSSKSLTNENLLLNVSKTLEVGSIIRIVVSKEVQNINITIEVFGENGSDKLFKESFQTSKNQEDQIVELISRKLDIYGKVIPYTARVLAVLGNQITFDAGNELDIKKGDKIFLKRPVKKKKHPFIDEIIDWQTIELTAGEVLNSHDQQSLARVKDGKKVKTYDWVIIDKKNKREPVFKSNFLDSPGSYSYGRIGKAGISFGQVSGENSFQYSGNNNKLSGNLLSLAVELETWITREFYLKFNYHKSSGDYDKNYGNFAQSSNSISFSKTDLVAGYKLLFLGYFYGPLVYGHLGLGRRNYAYNAFSDDGMGEFTVTGSMIGLGGEMPLMGNLRTFLEVETLLKGSYTEEMALYGESNSVSDYSLKLGVSYMYGLRYSLQGSFAVHQTKIDFSDTSQELSFKEKIVHLGAFYTF